VHWRWDTVHERTVVHERGAIDKRNMEGRPAPPEIMKS
jgi:hypothetical protein